jgi:RimJ/RimL family protein N-acetyltransferase
VAERALRGRLVELRRLRPSHASKLDPVLRDRQATRFLGLWTRQENGQQFVARILKEQDGGKRVAFVIVRVDSQETIGQINLFNWSRHEREAEVGLWLRRKYWGRGFGTEALRLICDYGFRSMRLHRIAAVVVDGNAGSKRALERAGFHDEGRSREAARLAGHWVDTWRLGLLRGELREPPARYAAPALSRTRRAR